MSFETYVLIQPYNSPADWQRMDGFEYDALDEASENPESAVTNAYEGGFYWYNKKFDNIDHF